MAARACFQTVSYQSRIAGSLLRDSETILIATQTFCEFAWVLASAYRYRSADIAGAVRALLSAGNVECDRQAIEFGLTVAEQGGDFADGVIAEAGFAAGADQFASFGRRAVRSLTELGRPARLLA